MDNAIHHFDVQSPSYDRIGGALFFLAAFLLLNPFRVLYVTESVAAHAFAGTGSSEAAYVLAFNIAFVMYSLLVPALFFLRKKLTPLLVAVLFLANIIFVAINGTVAQQLPDATRHVTDIFRMWEMILSALLFTGWTPYLLFSKRVRGTFVR